MPAAAIPMRRNGEFVVLEVCPPGRPPQPAGILLLDPSCGRLFLRLREDWDEIAGPEDAAILEHLDADLRGKMDEMGGERLLEWLEDSLSHTLRLSRREAVEVDAFSRVLDRLFEQHVGRVEVAPYRSHLPLYSLRAAATRFGEEEVVSEEEWVRAPENLRLAPGMFVAHVVGRSMEPRIPDGSLNIFRAPVVGSRQGKILLVEMFGVLEESARFTIKRYTSRKTYQGEDEWSHESIRLEPLNPEFQAFELGPDQFRVVAEWICTLE